jgi:hypothetical protein
MATSNQIFDSILCWLLDNIFKFSKRRLHFDYLLSADKVEVIKIKYRDDLKQIIHKQIIHNPIHIQRIVELVQNYADGFYLLWDAPPGASIIIAFYQGGNYLASINIAGKFLQTRYEDDYWHRDLDETGHRIFRQLLGIIDS